jgi:hypothetical protein
MGVHQDITAKALRRRSLLFFQEKEGRRPSAKPSFLIGPGSRPEEIGPLRVLDIKVKITSLQFVFVILEPCKLKRVLTDILIVA